MNEMEENMTAYVRYRLEKAQEVYRAAQVLYVIDKVADLIDLS